MLPFYPSAVPVCLRLQASMLVRRSLHGQAWLVVDFNLLLHCSWNMTPFPGWQRYGNERRAETLDPQILPIYMQTCWMARPEASRMLRVQRAEFEKKVVVPDYILDKASVDRAMEKYLCVQQRFRRSPSMSQPIVAQCVSKRVTGGGMG